MVWAFSNEKLNEVYVKVHTTVGFITIDLGLENLTLFNCFAFRSGYLSIILKLYAVYWLHKS